MKAPKPAKLLAGALLPAAGALAMIGCGGSSNAATNSTANISQQKAQAQFEDCLRQHGVNLSPSNNPGGPVTFRIDRNTPAFQSAFQACRSYLRNAFGNVTPAQQAQFRQQAVKFTACLRAHGQNVPDPTFNDAAPGGGPETSAGGSGSGGAVRQVFGGVDRNSPGFQAAVQACQSVAPKPPGGAIRIGVGGPGPGPAGAAAKP